MTAILCTCGTILTGGSLEQAWTAFARHADGCYGADAWRGWWTGATAQQEAERQRDLWRDQRRDDRV